MSRVTDARIDAGVGLHPVRTVFITLDGEEYRLFKYYPNEQQFTREEFIGKTFAEAKTLQRSNWRA